MKPGTAVVSCLAAMALVFLARNSVVRAETGEFLVRHDDIDIKIISLSDGETATTRAIKFVASGVSYRFIFSDSQVYTVKLGSEKYRVSYSSDGTVDSVSRLDTEARMLVDDRELYEDGADTLEDPALHHRRLYACEDCEATWDTVCQGSSSPYVMGSACDLVDYGDPFTTEAATGIDVLCSALGNACDELTAEAACDGQCGNDTALAHFTIEVTEIGRYRPVVDKPDRKSTARWEQVVTGVSCGGSSRSSGTLAVEIEFTDGDGPGNFVGRAGPTQVMAACPGISIAGYITFDIADVDTMEADGLLEGAFMHAMGHVLGVGTLWNVAGCSSCSVSDNKLDNAYGCPAAVSAYNELLGYPNETDAGIIELSDGIACSNFDEAIFGNEVMTGYIEEDVALSKMTAASLEDLGYVVDYSQVDDYILPVMQAAYSSAGGGVTGTSATGLRLDNAYEDAEIEMVDENGVVVGTFTGRRMRY